MNSVPVKSLRYKHLLSLKYSLYYFNKTVNKYGWRQVAVA